MGRQVGLFGVDIGTESLRTLLFDSTGTLLASAVRPHTTYSPQHGFFEQNPGDWWRGLKETVAECLRLSSFPVESVAAMGFTGTACTPLSVDAKGEAISPAIMWMDTRAHEEAKSLTAMQHPATKQSGNLISAEWMLPKALWVKKHQPEVWERTAKFMECYDYLLYKLSGDYVTSTSAAVGKRNWSKVHGGWPHDLYSQAGIPEFVEKNADEIVFPFEKAAVLSPMGAEELGLKPGVVLATCGPDGYAAMAGMNALSTKTFGLIIGSSNVQLLPTEKPHSIPGMWGPWRDILLPGQWLIEGGQLTTGSVLRWFVQHFAADAAAAAKQRGMRVYEYLDREASSIGAGSDGLIVLDYWQGNRTPFNDSHASGAIWGLTLNHSQAHVYRAVLEGIAYGTALSLNLFQDYGLDPKVIIACGGGTMSSLWLQIYADCCGLPVQVPENTSAAALGAAINASVAAGLYSHVTEASEAMVKLKDAVEPNAAVIEIYRHNMEHYRETYRALKDNMYSLSVWKDGPRGYDHG